MVETTVRCDKCGCAITDGTRTLLELQSGPYRPGRPTVDLCQEHYLEWAGWLDTPPGETEPIHPSCKPWEQAKAT